MPASSFILTSSSSSSATTVIIIIVIISLLKVSFLEAVISSGGYFAKLLEIPSVCPLVSLCMPFVPHHQGIYTLHTFTVANSAIKQVLNKKLF